MRFYQDPQTMIDIAVKLQATFTVVAATDVITSAAHGMDNNDSVILTTTVTLPAGLSLATVYYVVNATTNTFQLSLILGGPVVDITDTGTGAHTYTYQCHPVLCEDFMHVIATVDTKNSANMTYKFVGSTQVKMPSFGLSQSETNQWYYLQTVNLDTAAAVNGVTGTGPSGADIHTSQEYNINGMRWIGVIITTYTAGNAQITAKLYSNQ